MKIKWVSIQLTQEMIGELQSHAKINHCDGNPNCLAPASV